MGIGVIEMAKIPPVEVYRTHMVEFKLRVIHCEQVAHAKKSTTGLAALDSEFCFLQLRRLVELVAFSSALREEERYKTFRQIQQQSNLKDHRDHTRDWEAPEILRRMVKLSPYCLPIPLKREAKQLGASIQFDTENILITHGRLIEIYRDCGGFLHAKNPFGQDYKSHVDEERKKYEGARKEIHKCLAYFRKLMWYHAAVGFSWTVGDDPIAAADPKTAWVVDFGADTDQLINIVVGEAQ